MPALPVRTGTDLASRAEERVLSGAVEQVQAECGDLGRQLMILSFFNLSMFGEGVLKQLRAIGAELRLIEISRIYMDGGDSLRGIIARVEESHRRLVDLAASLRN
jgi:hypothetical protein